MFHDPCLGLCQRIRRKRKALLKLCRLALDIGDLSPRADVLLGLGELRDCVKAVKVPASKQSSATLLTSLLSILFDQMKTHAAKKLEGIPRMVYSMISGHDGLRAIRRIDTACLQYEKAAAALKEPCVTRSGGGGGWPRGRGANARPKKDMTNVKCYNCFSLGHVKANCPNKDQARGK